MQELDMETVGESCTRASCCLMHSSDGITKHTR